MYRTIRCFSFPTTTNKRTNPSCIPYVGVLREHERIYDPELWSTAADEDVTPEITTFEEPIEVTKNLKKCKYQYEAELSKVKSEGCAPIKRSLSLIRDHLQRRSGQKHSLSTVHVSLFNFHSTILAQRLLEKNIGHVTLVESGLKFSKDAKKFVKEQKNDRVSAYKAELSSLLGIGRKKVTTLPSHLMGKDHNDRSPLVLVPGGSCRTEESGGSRLAPILITALPFASQQQTVLKAFQTNLLLHHSGLDEHTIFAHGGVELVTFLSAWQVVQLAADRAEFSFMAHSSRRAAAVFSKFFHFSVLRKEGFARNSFDPRIPLPLNQKPIPHEKKLQQSGLDTDGWYAVSIRPRVSLSLSGLSPLNDLSSISLISFTYFMYLIGRQANSSQVAVVLKSIVPKSAETAMNYVQDVETIGEIKSEGLERVFVVVREELEATTEFQKFKDKLVVKRST